MNDEVDRVIGSYVFDKPKEEREAENRTDTLCIPYVRGASDCLRKQLAREGVNVIFLKERPNTRKIFDQWWTSEKQQKKERCV